MLGKEKKRRNKLSRKTDKEVEEENEKELRRTKKQDILVGTKSPTEKLKQFLNSTFVI